MNTERKSSRLWTMVPLPHGDSIGSREAVALGLCFVGLFSIESSYCYYLDVTVLPTTALSSRISRSLSHGPGNGLILETDSALSFERVVKVDSSVRQPPRFQKPKV
jgi:hypothetical protein